MYSDGLAVVSVFVEPVSAASKKQTPVGLTHMGAVHVFGRVHGKHQITVVASDVDEHVRRVIEYLQSAAVPVNAVLFSYFEDADRSYLARAWLVEPTESTSTQRTETAGGRKEPWNGQDWYASFGSESGRRDWEDAVKFGFVSAGAGDWYSRTLNSLPVGGRVFACIPKIGARPNGCRRFSP